MPGAARRAVAADLDAVVATIASAFATDPVWGWVFGSTAAAEVLWRPLVEGALRYPWVWVTPRVEAAAVWIPPGGTELSEAAAAGFEPTIRASLDAKTAARLLEAVHRFELAQPAGEPFYYLSLLGTTLAHRGKGLGMDLLRANLAEVDARHAAAYLESTNDANLPRYESVGFVATGEFAVADGGPVVTTMWRTPR
jgi:GNAT superfamily N-acetyltransferase